VYPCSSLDRCQIATIEIRIGDVAILSPEWSLSGDDRTDFLWLNYIIKNSTTSGTKLRGYRLIFFESLGPLSRRKDELCMLLHVDDNDKRHFNIQGQVEVPLTAVTGKSTVRMATSIPGTVNTAARPSQDYRSSAISCRRILILQSKTAKKRDQAVKHGKKRYLKTKSEWSQHKNGSAEAYEKTHERGQVLYIGRGCSGFIYRPLASCELEPHVLVRELEDLERRSIPTGKPLKYTDSEVINTTKDRKPYSYADYCAGLGGSAESPVRRASW